eukprot:5388828-Amphidinium_carterae.1
MTMQRAMVTRRKRLAAQQPYWSSSQYTYGGGYKQNPRQGRSPYKALREGNFPKANFTTGKTRKMKPKARQEGDCPDPEFEIKQGDESMVNMFVHNSGHLPTRSHDVMYSPWLPPSLAVEKMS